MSQSRREAEVGLEVLVMSIQYMLLDFPASNSEILSLLITNHCSMNSRVSHQRLLALKKMSWEFPFYEFEAYLKYIYMKMECC